MSFVVYKKDEYLVNFPQLNLFFSVFFILDLYLCSFVPLFFHSAKWGKKWNGVPTTLWVQIFFLLLLLNIFMYNISIQRFASQMNGTGSTIQFNPEFSACFQRWTYTPMSAWLSKYTNVKASQMQETTSYFCLLFICCILSIDAVPDLVIYQNDY